MERVIRGRPIVPGVAEADTLVTGAPLSFWGGYDPATGEIIDRRHALAGCHAAGKILVLPGTRGSSTSSAVLLEAVRNEVAPAAIVTHGVDAFIALAAVVAGELYGRTLPVIAIAPNDAAALRDARRLRIVESGTITIAE